MEIEESCMLKNNHVIMHCTEIESDGWQNWDSIMYSLLKMYANLRGWKSMGMIMIIFGFIDF